MSVFSFKKFISQFPFFLDKSESSNFYKSQNVTYNQFQGLLNDLFKVKQSTVLNKKIWIYKEQDEPYYYCMHFYLGFPLLKNIKIFREDVLVYEALFELNKDGLSSYLVHEDFPEYLIKVEENDDGEFEYIPSEIYTTDYNENDDIQTVKIDIYSSSQDIISNDKYYIEATTFDGYIVDKGFPENDTFLGDSYDHDLSLDEIGESNNIPRKEYVLIEDEDLYALTEPPFHNRLSEDDYHYMQRMLIYALKLHEIPLPCAEIYKLFGVDATLTNRERLLIRMVDMNKHPEAIVYDDEGHRVDFASDWVPQPWEHNDTLCSDTQEEIYFFVNVNNGSPLKGVVITFSFDFVNMFAESKSSEEYIIIPYIDGVKQDVEITEGTWDYDTNDLSDEEDNIFIFKCFKENDLNNPIFTSTEIQILLRDCRNANFYVNPSTGDDENTGNKENPFKTLNHALQSIDDIHNVIVLQSGTHQINTALSVDYDCNIISCDNAILENTESPDYFTVKTGCNLLIRKVNFKYKNINYFVNNTVFENKNKNDNFTVKIHTLKSNIELSLDKNQYIINDTLIKLTGKLLDEDNNPIPNKNILLKLRDEITKEEYTLNNVITSEKGLFNYNFDLWDKINVLTQNYTILAEYEDDFKYLNSNQSVAFEILEVPILLSADKSTILPGEYLTVTADYIENTPLDIYVDDELWEVNNTDENGKLTRKFLGGGYGTRLIKAKHKLTTSNVIKVEDLMYNNENITVNKGNPYKISLTTAKCFSVEINGYLGCNIKICDDENLGVQYNFLQQVNSSILYSLIDLSSGSENSFNDINWSNGNCLRADFQKDTIKIYLNDVLHATFNRESISTLKQIILTYNGPFPSTPINKVKVINLEE